MERHLNKIFKIKDLTNIIIEYSQDAEAFEHIFTDDYFSGPKWDNCGYCKLTVIYNDLGLCSFCPDTHGHENLFLNRVVNRVGTVCCEFTAMETCSICEIPDQSQCLECKTLKRDICYKCRCERCDSPFHNDDSEINCKNCEQVICRICWDRTLHTQRLDGKIGYGFQSEFHALDRTCSCEEDKSIIQDILTLHIKNHPSNMTEDDYYEFWGNGIESPETLNNRQYFWMGRRSHAYSDEATHDNFWLGKSQYKYLLDHNKKVIGVEKQ